MTTRNPNPDLLRGPVDVDHQLPAPHDSALRHKVDNLKSRGVGAIQDVQRGMVDLVARTNASVRDGMHSGVSQVQQSMRSKPMMWAGIAGGTGVALGLIGRFVHWRNKRALPDLVIVDAMC